MSAEPPKKRGREGSPPEEEVPDEVVVKVEDREFPCKKSHLAAHSRYFQRKFLSSLAEREREELVLKGVREQDFDLFLKIIDGTGEVTEENIQPLLRLAQYLEASGAERKCLQFLMVDSEKVVKEKFQLADRYRLEPLIVQILTDIHTPEDLRAIAPLIDVPTWNHKTLNHVLQKMYSLLGLQGDYFRRRADAEPVHVQIQQPQVSERAPQEIQNAAEDQAIQPRQPTPPIRVPDGPLMNQQNLTPAQLRIVRIATQMVQAASQAQNRLDDQDARGPQPNQVAAQALNQANQPRQPGMAGLMVREVRHNEAVASQPALRTLADGPAGIREHLQNQQNLIQAQLAVPMAQIAGQVQNRQGQEAQRSQPSHVAAQAQNLANQPRQPAPLNRFDVEMRAAIREQTQNQQNLIQAQLAAGMARVAGQAEHRLGEVAPQNQVPRRFNFYSMPIQNQNAQTAQPSRVLAQNPYYIARRAQIVQPILSGDAAAREHAQRVFLAGNRNPVLNQQNPVQAPYQAPMFPTRVPALVPAPNRNAPGPNHPVLDNGAGAVPNPVPQNQVQPVQPVGEQLIQLLLPEDRALGAQLYATLEAMKARSRAAHVEAPYPPGQADRVAERQEPAE
ncbi:unnamed protein product [Caenorhabditis brenneri]